MLFAVAQVTPSGSRSPTYAGPPPTSPTSNRSTSIVSPAYAVGSMLKSGIANCGFVEPFTWVNTVMSSIADTVPQLVQTDVPGLTRRTAYPLWAFEKPLPPLAIVESGVVHGPTVALQLGHPFHC